MSFPDYLNKIINSQLKNKQIQTVRAEITKLISTNKQKKQNNVSETQDKTTKARQMPKTMSNFFNVHSLHQQKDPKIDPRKTFSEMHINRLKKRLTLEEQNRNTIEVPVPQQASMNEWRLQMLKHLKTQVKKPLFQPRPQPPTKEIGQQQYNASKESKHNQKFKFNKSAKATSSPVLRRMERKQRPKDQLNDNNIQVSSQRNIILIRPHPVSEDQFDQKAVPKLKKATFKQKRASKRSDTQDDEFTVQRLANFTALLPYLGAQKAKVQMRQQKKPKPIEEIIIPERSQYNYQRKTKKIPEQIIEITGWDIQQD